MARGGICYPKGFSACGLYAGIKKKRSDLGLLVCDVPASLAALFTTNRIKGETLEMTVAQFRRTKKLRALLVVSGISNCLSGPQGRRDAERLRAAVAHCLDLPAQETFLGTTGVIGARLPAEKIEEALPRAARRLSRQGGEAFARAIMTTDRVPKEATRSVGVAKRRVRLGGCAKGAGMIAPSMATMFAFVTTDLQILPEELQGMLRAAVDRSFHQICVDNDQSPADMVMAMASGKSGVRLQSRKERLSFQEALTSLCRELAEKIVSDAEGATKQIFISVAGAASGDDARRIARCVAHSFLVKTAFFGEDPNWGRILTSAGSCGARIEKNRVSLRINGRTMFERGAPTRSGLKPPQGLLSGKRARIEMTLGLGKGSAEMLTSDLSYDYVRINAEYHT